jgi:demethylmenaquinone methyltransferase/2-methoxy-6-polyprenyl-1,4-benzoquinol methylase
MEYSLEHVKETYRAWGRHPWLYKFACVVTFLGREAKLRKLAVEEMKIEAGDTVLDLACGTGLNHRFLEDAVGPNGKIIAFDYSSEMLLAAKKRAKKYNWSNIVFIQGDAAQLLLDIKVDGVLSTLGISAIPEHEEALKRAVDVLKDNKRISILDARLPAGFWSIFNPFIAYIYKHWASWDYTKRISDDLRQLIVTTKIKVYNGGTIYIVYGTKETF